MGIIITCLIGLLVGCLASWFMKKGFPWYINILIGIGGSWLGSWLAGLLGLSADGIVGFIFSVVGASIIIWIISKLR
ncbi:MAG: GlsB/YeaQ/YmgE family stress response membrane protein [Bacteroidia bacterium]|nr:GlsB/YeaQ/YmgE family stress response membrane protein [Bacteroidia bacterium]